LCSLALHVTFASSPPRRISMNPSQDIAASDVCGRRPNQNGERLASFWAPGSWIVQDLHHLQEKHAAWPWCHSVSFRQLADCIHGHLERQRHDICSQEFTNTERPSLVVWVLLFLSSPMPDHRRENDPPPTPGSRTVCAMACLVSTEPRRHRHGLWPDCAWTARKMKRLLCAIIRANGHRSLARDSVIYIRGTLGPRARILYMHIDLVT
jgi:hypothetical protein